jgi:NAD(P)-dependent dehydrogenase (short-subunit alcohol dehydrogenase family)
VFTRRRYQYGSLETKERKKGSIINISSAFGKVGGANASVYVASKHAIEGLTKSAAIEVDGTGVRVSIVGPGPVETGMLNRSPEQKQGKADFLAAIPLKPIGTPEEIAHAIIFISSDKASFIIGASLAVDGGQTAD